MPGSGTEAGDDSYTGIEGGLAYPLTEITGQSITSWALSGMSTSALNSLGSTLATAFAANGEVLLSTQGQSQGSLVAGQMFEVTGIDASTGTVTIQNPANAVVDQNGVATSFTETIAQLAAYGASLYASSPS